MVNSVNGANGGEAPKGYTKVKLYDEQTKETKTFFIPIGKKISFNGNTYDPSKGKNNEFVITGTKGEPSFDIMGIALEHFDVNNDGRIDKKDSMDEMRLKNEVEKDPNLPDGYFVDMLDPNTPRAWLQKGSAYLNFSKEHLDEHGTNISID